MTTPFVVLQHLLPKQLLTSAAGAFARAELGGLTTGAIRWFAGRYRVNLAEAEQPDPASYRSFNEFFTRPLRAGARPLAQADFICPVDGAVSVVGALDGDRLVQAKGHSYTTTALLGGDAERAALFAGGSFATIYLSPRDYHRIHMPVAGRLTRMVHVPGALFSVNPETVRGVPGLFARNERVVCHFETAFGPFVLVLVGATIVGSMATVWHGVVNPPRPGQVRAWDYPATGDGSVTLAQGAEMGRFLLGSTVVMLFPKPGTRFGNDWLPGRATRMGEAMATAGEG
ncbi:archaetidylserine decarboxylase [Pseudogemmatithrix spongiicola]|uniref:Phosphatidylserine decarboxylase proenzyme n=1 Tax=Pseudogemmatithrix spongiicola TaxID=3062599 RepID=A0AA49JXJ1_9BACT|nr:archaetidylserine decarboxylase [Gemmatimonadaceae bacterium 'strain 138']WKW13899.1 archaetidylserine decarboxylase [Gemmatimonadaceae bacterium 'strain 318']